MTHKSQGADGRLRIVIAADDLARFIEFRALSKHDSKRSRLEPWDVIEERLKEIVFKRWGYWPATVLESSEARETEMNIETLKQDLRKWKYPNETKYPITLTKEKLIEHGISENIAERLDGIRIDGQDSLPVRANATTPA